MRNVTIAFAFFSLCSCGTHWNKNNNSLNDSIKGIKVSRLFPVVGNDGKLKVYDPNQVLIYFYRDQVMYKNLYSFLSHSTNGEILKSEKRASYLVYTKGTDYGYFTDSNLLIFDKKLLVDSAINKEWYGSDILSLILPKVSSVKISSKLNDSKEKLEEIYSVKVKTDSMQTGTIFLSFTTSLKDIDYSLSRELDSIKNMKLYKIKIVNDSRYLKDYNITVDRVEQNREMESIPVSNRTEILSFFERDKKYNSQHQ